MKTIYKGLAMIGFALMGIVVFAIIVSFTLNFSEQLWPDNMIARYGSVIFSDLGALIWIGVFVKLATTQMQRITAFVMFLFDLAIVALMIGVNTLVYLENYAEIQQIATVALAISAFVNLASVYWFHLHGQETHKEIEFGDITAEVEQDAMNQLRERKKDLSNKLQHILGERLLDDALANFRITRAQLDLPDDASHKVIDSNWKNPAPKSGAPVLNGHATPPAQNGHATRKYNVTAPINTPKGKKFGKLPKFISDRIITTVLCPTCTSNQPVKELPSGDLECLTCHTVLSLTPMVAGATNPTSGGQP